MRPRNQRWTLSVMLCITLLTIVGFRAEERADSLPQDPPCRGPDEISGLHLWILKQRALWTAPDLVAGWQTMGFVPVSPAEITLVTDQAVCSAVVQAYSSAADLDPPDDPPRDSLYVIRVGPRYDAFDPTVRDGEFIVHRIFDTAFVHIKTHAR